MFKKLKLSTRILLLGVAITLCFILLFGWLYPKIRSNMYAAKYQKTRHLVEASWGVIDHHASLAKSGAVTETDAKKAAMNTIREMRYDGKEYFWIKTAKGNMVMHPIKPALDGKALLGMKDKAGKLFFQEMVDVASAKGEGFVEYVWPKPGSPEPMPKISFVKLHPGWDWIIGSGIYIDDVEKEISALFLLSSW